MSEARWLIPLALALMPAAGCSKDACEEGYDRQRDCVLSMNCSGIDPGLRGQCEAKKKQFSADYTIYKAYCQLPDGSACECEGEWEQQWERMLECTLEPKNLCECR